MVCLSLLGIKRIGIFRPQSVVSPAISRDIANGMLKENECYIVRVANYEKFDLSYWYYTEGKEKNE